MTLTAALIRKDLEPTPLVRSVASGDDVWLKLESFQPTGSFKIRGAYAALAALKKGTPVVACSAGNHGLGVAYVGRQLGIDVTIVTSRKAAARKRELLRASGARLVLHGGDYDAAEKHAKELAVRMRAKFVSPYNDARVILGQGGVGVELLEQIRGNFTVVAPVGGGGLAAGVGLAIARRRGCRLVGVEAARSAPMRRAFARGRIVPIKVGDTIADGLAGNLEEGSITYPLLREHCEKLVTVTEAEIRAAMRHLAREHGLIVEPAGAVAVAAILAGKVRGKGRRVAVVTGRNIDLASWVRFAFTGNRGKH